MIDPELIFQRTSTGRDEIYEKKRGLTQSERLVLIMIDGTSSYLEVRSKLPVLSDERFSRAIMTLQKKDLILEVFLPVEGQVAEEVERTVIDRFLQQDPTDPLTIMSYDPDEEFGIESFVQAPPAPIQATAPIAPAHADPVPPSAAPNAPSVAESPLLVSPMAMDESLIQQADSLAEEVRARLPQHVIRIEQAREASARRRAESEQKQKASAAQPKSERLHWGYWLIGVGLAFIVGFVVARLTH